MASSVAEAFLAVARRFASRPALINANDSNGESIVSYGRLLQVAHRGAHKYFRHGEVIVVGIDEGRDLVAIELAAWLAGAGVCPFDVRNDPRANDVIARLDPEWIVLANSKFIKFRKTGIGRSNDDIR